MLQKPAGEEPKLTLLAPAFHGASEALPLDVAVNAETPLYAAALLSESAQWDLRAKQLILLVRPGFLYILASDCLVVWFLSRLF